MLAQLLVDVWRLLTFRQPSSALIRHWRSYLAFGLISTWIAGIGRYWDHPAPHWLQRAGFGSLIYVLALTVILWLLILPLRPKHWTPRNILIFVTLTSPPAWLYAIPVERLMSMAHAQSANAWFLAIVATSRVALLVVFLKRVAKLRGAALALACVLPLALIVFTLSVLNLDHVVFSLMSGTHPDRTSANDTAFAIVWWLSALSVLSVPILAVWYPAEMWRAYVNRANPNPQADGIDQPPRRG